MTGRTTTRLEDLVEARFGERVRALGRWLDDHPWIGPGLAAVTWLVIVVNAGYVLYLRTTIVS